MADFIRVSKRFRGKAVFHVSSDPDILHTLDPGGAPVEELPRIYVVRGGEPKNTPRFCGEMDFESLLRWVTEKHEATLQELNESNAQTLLNGENGKLVLLGLLEPQTNLGKELIADLSRAAHEIAKQTDKTPRVVVAFLDIAKYPDHARRLYNHSPGAGPKIVVADPSNDRYFEDHLDGTFIGLEAAELVAAAEAARTGKLLVRYTDGVFVRTVKRISRSMHNLGSMVSSKPAFVVLVLFAVIASAVALLLFADSSGAGQKSGGKAE